LDLDINVHGAPNFRAPHPIASLTSPSTSSPPTFPPYQSTSTNSPYSSHPPTPTPPIQNTNTNGQNNLNVYGCAQPRIQGLRAILSVLRCRLPAPASAGAVLSPPSGSGRQGGQGQGHVVWFCTREEPIGKPLPLPHTHYLTHNTPDSIHIRPPLRPPRRLRTAENARSIRQSRELGRNRREVEE
jgi:hypothetical protein